MKKVLVGLMVCVLAVSANATVVAYYDFEEGTDGSGSTGSAPTTSGWIVDSGTDGNNGTVTSVNESPSYVSANGSTALDFSGYSNSGVTLDSASGAFNWGAGESKTLEFALCRNGDGSDTSATEYVLAKSFTSWGGWEIHFNRTTGLLVFNFRGTTISSTTVFEDGQWHHVAITRDGDTGIFTLYVDYEVEATLTGVTDGSVKSETTSIGCGYGWTSARAMNATIDNLRISDEVLSPSEFLAIPEPATLALVGLGMLMIGRKKK